MWCPALLIGHMLILLELILWWSDNDWLYPVSCRWMSAVEGSNKGDSPQKKLVGVLCLVLWTVGGHSHRHKLRAVATVTNCVHLNSAVRDLVTGAQSCWWPHDRTANFVYSFVYACVCACVYLQSVCLQNTVPHDHIRYCIWWGLADSPHLRDISVCECAANGKLIPVSSLVVAV